MKLRVVGDIHAEAENLQEIVDEALELGRKLIFDGDIIAKGSDNLGVMAIVVGLVKKDLAEIVCGNWEKALLARTHGKKRFSHYDDELDRLYQEVKDAGSYGQQLFDDFVTILENSYAWIVLGSSIITHAVWNKDFLQHGLKPKICELTAKGLDAFGYACTGHKNYSETEDFEFSPFSLDWVDDLEPGQMVYVGHVSVPKERVVDGANGGKAVLLDTGSGKKKNGYISYLDLEIQD